MDYRYMTIGLGAGHDAKSLHQITASGKSRGQYSCIDDHSKEINTLYDSMKSAIDLARPEEGI